MDFKKTSEKLLRVAFIILSYLAIVAIALIISRERSLFWKVLIDHYIRISTLRFILFTSVAATVGSFIYYRRHIIIPFLKTDTFRYVSLLVVAAGGFYFKFHALDLIILLYAVYAILFINRSLEKTRLYKSALNLVDRLMSVLFHSESRTPALLALLLLICLPMLLILKKTAIAENVAVYAYYLLIITVILQIIEIKLGIERGNHLLVLLRDTSRTIYAALTNKDKWTKLASWVYSSCKRLFTWGKILYVTLLIIILGSLYVTKHLYWKNMVLTLDTNPQYRSQVSILKPDVRGLSFPSNTDEIMVPIRIKHLASKPLLWQNSGENAVKIGIMWFQENQAGQMELKEYEDYQSLPKSLLVSDSVEMSLKLNRAAVPTGRTYEVWVGLVSDGNWWFSKWGDDVLKFRIYAEKLFYEKDYFIETRIHEALQRKMEEVWSMRLSSFGNAYHSTIEVSKNNLLSKNKISVFVKNEGRIPWPVHNQDPVKLGVVWLQRLEKQGSSRYIHLYEEKFALPDIISPGERKEVELSFDPFKVRNADEIWIGMVHEGKTWFYKQGDPALKLMDDINKYKLLARQTAIVRDENMRIATELDKQRQSGNVDKARRFENESYRSNIQLLNYKADALLESKKDGLVLELEITNTGKVPWRLDQPANEKPVNVNLGILWFNKSEEKMNYSTRKAEERCGFPFAVLENVIIRMECKIGGKVQPGNYEVWIGPVHEYVSWFYDKGDQVLKLDVTVP